MIDVSIFKKSPIPYTEKWVKEIVGIAAKKEKKIKGEVEIIIVGDSEIKRLNKQFRNKNKVTDVLSFAWQEDNMVVTNVLGQIYVCYPQIKRQAKIWQTTIKEEFSRMLVHGLLHLVGHDHMAEKDANKMFALQEEIIKMVK